MLSQAINGVIGSIFDVAWNSIKRQYKENLSDRTELEEERSHVKRSIIQASKEYHQRYLARYGHIKVLPGLMKEAIPLDSIYTAVKFLSSSSIKYFTTLDDLEELYRQSGKRQFSPSIDQRQDGLSVANNEQYLMVLGGPGVGKSTFLRKLGLETLNGQLDYALMPVLIELKSLRRQDLNLLQTIARELEITGFPHSESLVESLLSEGKMLILLDGLDEVSPRYLDEVISHIGDFCDQYSQNRFVISCRTAAYKGGFSRFTDVTMAEFDDAQIEQFIHRWFSAELDTQYDIAANFWNMLQSPENVAAKELAQTPLLLTFLCLVYDRSQSLPVVRSTLYGDALNIFLKDWAAEQRIMQDPIYQGFHADLEKELLSEIAYQGLKENRLFFSKQEITNQITSFLADTLDAPKYLDGTAILQAIEIQQGILVERAADVYSFSHLVLQEYLAARYIVTNGLVDELVREHLMDDYWHEVFLLVSGLIERQINQLLMALEKEASNTLRTADVTSLLSWASLVARFLEEQTKPAAKRALSILFAAEWNSPYASELILQLDPELHQRLYPNGVKISYQEKNRLIHIFQEITSKIGRKVPEISESSKEIINDYLRINSLIISCKQSAVRISRKEWEAIESRILLVGDEFEVHLKEIVFKFLTIIDVETDNQETDFFEIKKLPKGIRLSLPIVSHIALNQSIEKGINNLLEYRRKNKVGFKTAILFYQDQPTTEDRKKITEARLDEQLTLVPIPVADIEASIQDSKQCISTFDGYVRRYAKPSDLFNDRQSIDDRLLFFGRIKLLSAIKQDLSRNQGVGLFGVRKSGKTSVIKQVALIAERHPVVQLDLQRFRGSNYSIELFNEILKQLHLLVISTESDEEIKLKKLVPGTSASEVSVRFISEFQEMSSLLENLGYEMPIFCFIDEIERILPLPSHPKEVVEEFNSCLGTLRVLSQEQRVLSLLVADVHPDCNRINQWSQKDTTSNPVFSFFKEVFLTPFSEKETIQMLTDIGNLMGLEISEKIAEQIHLESGGHPFIARQISHYLYQSNLADINLSSSYRLTQDDWEDILIDFPELSNYFEESIWKDIKKRDQESILSIFKIIAARDDNSNGLINEKGIFSKLEEEYSSNETRKSLSWLKSIGFLSFEKRQNTRYIKFKLPIFIKWLRMSMNSEEVKKWS